MLSRGQNAAPLDVPTAQGLPEHKCRRFSTVIGAKYITLSDCEATFGGSPFSVAKEKYELPQLRQLEVTNYMVSSVDWVSDSSFFTKTLSPL